MSPAERGPARSIRLRNYVWVLVILWTTTFAFTLTWALIDKSEQDTGSVAGGGAESRFARIAACCGGMRPVAAFLFPPRVAPPLIERSRDGDVGSEQRLVAGGCFRHDP